MSPTSPGPSLLSVAEVARRLSISVRSVRGLIQSGALQTIRITPRRVAIDEVDLAAYVAMRRAAPSPIAAA